MPTLAEYCRCGKRPVSEWVENLPDRDQDSARRRFGQLLAIPNGQRVPFVKKEKLLFKVSWEGDAPCRLYCHWREGSLVFLYGCRGKPFKPSGAYGTGLKHLQQIDGGKANVCNFDVEDLVQAEE